MQSKKINELGTNVSPSVYDLTVVGDAATGQLKKITLNQIASLFGSVGGVSSVAMTVPTGLTVTGSPITTSGTLAVTLTAGYSIPTTAKQSEWDTGYAERLKWDGGASGLSAPTARTSLGLVIGTDVLAYRTFGSAANNNTADFATAAQGTNADTAYTLRLTGASAPLSISENVISITEASTTVSGFLSSANFNTFNGKQAALNGTGFVKATGTTISYDNTSYLPLGGGILTGALTAQVGILFSTTQTISTSGTIGFNSTQGIFIYGKTGSSYDFKLYNGVGSTTIQIPTGTQNVEFLGSVQSTDFRYTANGFLTYDTDVTGTNTMQIRSGYAGAVLSFSGVGNASFSGNVDFKGESVIDGNNFYLKTTASNSDLAINYNGKTTASLIFYSGTTERFKVTSSGAATFSSSVTAATDLISSNGTLYVSAGSGLSYSSRLSTAYNFPYVDTYLDSFGGTSYEGRLNFRTNSGGGAMSTKMTILNNGNVGIGTDSPEALLHLNKAASGGEGAFIFLDNSAGSALGNKSGIRFGNNTGASFSNYDSYIEAINVNADNGAASLTFGTWDGASRGERMRITSGGNIGIGISTPTTYSLAGTHLEVFGGSNFSFIHNNTTTVKSFFSSNESSLLTALFTFSAHPLTFGTSNTERARITSSGNILVSTTTDNGQGKLQVNGAITALNVSYTGEIVTGTTNLNTTYYHIISTAASSGSTFTLPSPTSNNLQYVIINKSIFSQTISAGSGFTIYDMAGNNSATITLAAKARCYIIADGSSFYQIF